MKKITLFAFVLSTVALAVQSCKKGDNSPAPSATSSSSSSSDYANFKVYLTDAPASYDEVNVDVQQVEIHSSGGGWQTLSVLNPGIYNLLEYSNGLDTLILNDSLPVGNISQIRLILGANNTIMVDSVTYPLSTLSGQQSGLKLQIHQKLEAGITYAITLDFDVAHSVHKTGNGVYKLKPVIRTITAGVDGAIKGKIVPGAITPVFAIMGTDTLGGMSDANGNFLIQGVTPETYSLLVTPVAPLTDTTVSNVSVSAGGVTDVGTITIN